MTCGSSNPNHLPKTWPALSLDGLCDRYKYHNTKNPELARQSSQVCHDIKKSIEHGVKACTYNCRYNNVVSRQECYSACFRATVHPTGDVSFFTK